MPARPPLPPLARPCTSKSCVFGFPAVPDTRIGFAGGPLHVYRLTLTTGPFAAHAFPLAVERGRKQHVELVGANLPAALRDWTPADTPPLATFLGRELAWPVAVRVEPHACVTEREPNGRDRPQAVPFPATISGRIDAPGDRDVFRLTLKQGQAVRLTLEARDLDSPLDGVLTVYDETGKNQLAGGDDQPNQPDSMVEFTPAEK